jgi:predicted DNA-binding transcriptional regulator AlpA
MRAATPSPGADQTHTPPDLSSLWKVVEVALMRVVEEAVRKAVEVIPQKATVVAESPAARAEGVLLTPIEVARAVRLGLRTVQRMVAAGTFVQPVMVNPRRPRWRAEDIQEWLEKKRRKGRKAS